MAKHTGIFPANLRDTWHWSSKPVIQPLCIQATISHKKNNIRQSRRHGFLHNFNSNQYDVKISVHEYTRILRCSGYNRRFAQCLPKVLLCELHHCFAETDLADLHVNIRVLREEEEHFLVFLPTKQAMVENNISVLGQSIHWNA